MTNDLPHLTFSPESATPHPHTPKGGGGVASFAPNPPNRCRTSGVAGVADWKRAYGRAVRERNEARTKLADRDSKLADRDHRIVDLERQLAEEKANGAALERLILRLKANGEEAGK